MPLCFDLLFSIFNYTGNKTLHAFSTATHEDLATAAALTVKEARLKINVTVHVHRNGSTSLFCEKILGPRNNRAAFFHIQHVKFGQLTEQNRNQIDHITIKGFPINLFVTQRINGTVMDLFAHDNLQCKTLHFVANYGIDLMKNVSRTTYQRSECQENVACSILQRCLKDIKINFIKISNEETIPWRDFEEMQKHIFLDDHGNISIDLVREFKTV
ncbi:hypothetical protein L596_030913 [Steinernema carpocapsae]|uniref:Uncharacterized protein n=1 Tax=Steinernema carpocapsae TaxID=34508 RepID=A0A4U5MHA3_STECR|nr:hypothetical protein L596_030913 [Steinernema carpocapsae]